MDVSVGGMKKCVIFLRSVGCALICTPAVAEGWSYSFFRGFDLYLSGTGQSGIRLVCDRDTNMRKGSILEVQTALKPLTIGEAERLVIGTVSFTLSGDRDFEISVNGKSSQVHADLAQASANAKKVQIWHGGAVVADIIIEAGRPSLCY